MKTSIAILGLLLFLSCNGQRSTLNIDVRELKEKLPLIKNPILLPDRLNRFEKNIELPDNRILSELLAKYKERHLPFILFGKVFESDAFVAIFGAVPAGPGAYIILTFGNDGKQVDSLAVLPNYSGYTIDSVSSEDEYLSAKIFSINEIITIDSAISYDVKMEKGIPIEIQSTKSISIQTRKYRITEKGKIEIVD